MVPDRYIGEKKKGATAPFFALFLAIGSLGFWMLAWLLPNHYPPWVVFENEACAVIALLLALLALQLRAEASLKLPSRVLYWIVVFAGVIALQGLFEQISRQQAVMGLFFLTLLALSYILGSQVYVRATEDSQRWEALACTFVLMTTLLSAGVVLVQLFGLEHAYPGYVAPRGSFRYFGNLGQPNNQATFLVMGLIALDILVRRQRVVLWVAICGLCLLIPAVWATGSRSGLLGALCASAVLILTGDKAHRVYTLLWAATLLGLYLFGPALGDVMQAQGVRGSSELWSDRLRVLIYTELLKAVLEQPWLGYGYGRTGYAQSMMAIDSDIGMAVSNAHNLPLELLVWFGVPIGGALGLIGMFLVVGIWRRLDPTRRLLMCLLIPFAVHSLVELPYAYTFFVITFGLVLGYLATAAVGSEAIRLGRVSIWVLGLAVAVGGGAVLRDYVLVAEEFRIVRFEYRKVGSLPKEYQPFKPLVLTDLRGMLDATRIAVDGALDEGMVSNLRRQAFEYHIPLSHIKLISYLLYAGQTDAAEIEMQRYNHLRDVKTREWGGETLHNTFCSNETEEQHAVSCKLVRKHFSQGLLR